MQSFATTTELFSHQAAAVAKLRRTRIGALFMEQGTGKSRTAIEWVHQRRPRIDHVVWFCPVSLKATIAAEIGRHTTCDPARVVVFDATTHADTLPPADWYIVGIESLSSSTRVILAVQRLITAASCVILDESQYIKGHRARRTERITRFSERARYRLALTGTPITQGVVDLYAQLRFLSPKILGYTSFYSFAANHLEYSEKYPGMVVRAHNVGWLTAKMAPYVYQVTKEECLTLPAKLYRGPISVDLTGEQADAYRAAKEETWERIARADHIAVYEIFRLFTMLQQIVSGFTMWGGQPVPLRSHRLTALLTAIAEGPEQPTIIWAKYRWDIGQITTALTARYGTNAVGVLDGSVSLAQRTERVAAFRQDRHRFLVATQSVAGHGLTINEAEWVIFYNNGFKYSERVQAEDRCHRIGQTHPVVYQDVLCDGTIDDRIATALARKESVVRAFHETLERAKTATRKELIRNL